MESRISFVTLGVSDLEASREFYRRLLDKDQLNDEAGVAFFEMGRTWLALYPRGELAADAGMQDGGSGGFPGFALAHNVRTAEEVDAVLEEAERAGGRIVKPGAKAFWGGYTGYFADPDGFLWEVAWNPNFPHV
ncbi:MAG TPA: VOC family protein [Trueperaceae bacterium]